MSRPIPGAALVALLLAGLIFIAFPLCAQTREPSDSGGTGDSPGTVETGAGGEVAPDETASSENNGYFETDASPGTGAAVGTGSSLGTDENAIFLGEAAAAPVAPDGSSVWVVLRMVLVLALAALAIYGVVFFMKRLARPRENLDPHLKVLARVSLGGDSYAAVISLGAKAWLVGGGSGGVSLVSEVSDTETLETLLLDDARRNAEAGGGPFVDFRSLLSRLGGRPREEQSVSPGASHAENIRRQRERLKGL